MTSISKRIFVENISENLKIDEAKKIIKTKFFESIYSIEKKISAKIDITINEEEENLVLNNRYSFKFSRPPFYDNKTVTFEGRKTIEFPCKFSHFNLSNPHISLIIIIFDDDLNIEKFWCELRSKDRVTFDQEQITQEFNHLLELIRFEYCYRNLSKDIEIGFIKKENCISSFEDELLFWYLHCNPSEINKELIPEYYDHSAYNFYSQSFSDRLQLLKMLQF